MASALAVTGFGGASPRRPPPADVCTAGRGRARRPAPPSAMTDRESMAADNIDIDIDIVAAPAELDALEPLWIALHRHHRTVVPSPALLVDDDSVSWSRRRALLKGWMATGDALVLVAGRGGAPIGYAVAHLQKRPRRHVRRRRALRRAVLPLGGTRGARRRHRDRADGHTRRAAGRTRHHRPLDRGDDRQRRRASGSTAGAASSRSNWSSGASWTRRSSIVSPAAPLFLLFAR